jgi:hypothetical protein
MIAPITGSLTEAISKIGCSPAARRGCATIENIATGGVEIIELIVLTIKL